MSDSIEGLVINTLVFNKEYTRQVLPHLKKEYFEQFNNKVLFEELSQYMVKYDQLPSKEALTIELENRSDLNDSQYKEIKDQISYLNEEPHESKWLVDTTEKWCRDRAIYIALLESCLLYTSPSPRD